MTNSRTLPFELKPAGGPFDDPALLVSPSNHDEAVLLDSGTLYGLTTRDLQKVRWLFLTHLHIDHLIGFDHLLRVRLFSSLPLTVYGPQGTADIIAHRLQGYAWNLTSGSPFVVRVFELQSRRAQGTQLSCHHSFRPEPTDVDSPEPTGEVTLLPNLTVRSIPVDHGVPCLAYRIERRTLPKFSLETAQSLGLSPGPWVKTLIAGGDVEQQVGGVVRDQQWLAQRLLAPPCQHSLGYLTDTRLDEELRERLASFFRGLDFLCSETAYLNSESALAAQNLHMTTSQAANLAYEAGVGELKIFHLSRRHREAGPEQHLAEVRQVFARSSLLNDGALTQG